MNPQTQWEQGVIEKMLMEVFTEQKRARRWKIFFRIVMVVLVLLFLIAPIIANRTKIAELASAHTASIDLTGVIGGQNDSADTLIRGMEEAYKNPQVKGIVIRANSPGGSPVFSGLAYDQMMDLKKAHPKIPVIVVVEEMCASGCYYIASAADKIYANQASLVGSIGVISGGFGFDKAIEKLGIERRLRTSGKNKGMGDAFSPENPEQNQIWQTILDDVHAQFISAVKAGRGDRLKESIDPDIFSGRVYIGSQGLKNGLIDGLGSVQSVAKDVIKAPNVVDYTPQENFGRKLSRALGSEIKNTLDEATQTSW